MKIAYPSMEMKEQFFTVMMEIAIQVTHWRILGQQLHFFDKMDTNFWTTSTLLANNVLPNKNFCPKLRLFV